MKQTRKQVIQRLVMMKSYAIGEDYEALDYSITSLKTDEAYQIMYEGGEIFTKDDVVDMLEKLKSEIDDIPNIPYTDHSKWCIDGDVLELIQQKINELKADKE